MPRKASTFNLTSPNQIRAECDLTQLTRWFESEAQAITDPAIRQVICHLVTNLAAFVRFPKRSVLLWQGCDRVAPVGQRQKYHKYPAVIKDAANKNQISLDTRPNGPAIVSFLLAGGERPKRFGSTNAWNIHHLYSGKFPYPGRAVSLHAQKDGKHFTQSAGLVAVHPLADALCDEFPAYSWLLRANAFQQFGYDPDGVFTESDVDAFGFVNGPMAETIYSDENG